jgi:hypothetical protein
MKEFVLDLIDNMPSKDVGVDTINLDDNYTDLKFDYKSHISKTNWQDEIFGEEWAQIWPHFLSPTDQFQVVNSIKNNYPDRDWSKGEVTESWFNQYIAESGSEHPWHHHADSERKSGEKNPCINLASIYYVELPDESLITILKDPDTGEEIIPDVKEGQILTFGADILHKSPRNFSNKRKTVIPFNIMFD